MDPIIEMKPKMKTGKKIEIHYKNKIFHMPLNYNNI